MFVEFRQVDMLYDTVTYLQQLSSIAKVRFHKDYIDWQVRDAGICILVIRTYITDLSQYQLKNPILPTTGVTIGGLTEKIYADLKEWERFLKQHLQGSRNCRQKAQPQAKTDSTSTRVILHSTTDDLSYRLMVPKTETVSAPTKQTKKITKAMKKSEINPIPKTFTTLLQSVCSFRFHNHRVYEMPNDTAYEICIDSHYQFQLMCRDLCMGEGNTMSIFFDEEHKIITFENTCGVAYDACMLEKSHKTKKSDAPIITSTITTPSTSKARVKCGEYLLRSLKLISRYFHPIDSVTLHCKLNKPLIITMKFEGRCIAIAHLRPEKRKKNQG